MAEILLFILALLVLGVISRGIQALADMVNLLEKLLKPRRKLGASASLPKAYVHQTHP
jgi:hypothetical protein